jgi:hypothetical protein
MTSRQDLQKRRVWELRLGRFRTNGLTVARFCAQEGVSTNTFYYWAKRVGAPAMPVRAPRSRRVDRSERDQQSTQHPALVSGSSHGALVRFHWNAAVEVFVPADCLDAIRCLAECLRRAEEESVDGFQELVVRS